MTAFISPPPKLQFFTNAGVPMVGGLLYTYAAGTTTPLVTYTDSTGLVANTNPVILDSRGEASIWLSTVGYKFKLATPANVDVWTQDNIYSGWLTPTANLPMGGFKFTGAANGVAATDFATYGQLQSLAGWAPTADLPMGGFKFTGAGNGVARTDFATYGQLQDSAGTLLTAVAGTNTVTATLTNLAAYAAGQVFTLIPTGANTGAVTLNINSLGAVAITKFSSAPLSADDLAPLRTYSVIYDGTQFQLLNAPSVLFRQSSVVQVINTLTTTNFFSTTIPAGILSTSKAIEIEAWGDQFNNTGVARTITLTMLYGASTVFTTGAVSWGTSGNGRGWYLKAAIAANGAANGQSVAATMITGTTATNGGVMAIATGDFITSATNALAENSATPLALSLNATLSFADPANLFTRCRMVLVNVL